MYTMPFFFTISMYSHYMIFLVAILKHVKRVTPLQDLSVQNAVLLWQRGAENGNRRSYVNMHMGYAYTCVCMYACTHIYMYVCIYICVYIKAWSLLWKCVCVGTNLCKYVELIQKFNTVLTDPLNTYYKVQNSSKISQATNNKVYYSRKLISVISRPYLQEVASPGSEGDIPPAVASPRLGQEGRPLVWPQWEFLQRWPSPAPCQQSCAEEASTLADPVHCDHHKIQDKRKYLTRY